MKRIYNVLGSMVAMVAILAACTEDITDLRLEPGITSLQKQNVTATTADVEAYVPSGINAFSEIGVAYGLTENPTVDDNKAVFSGKLEKAMFTVTLTGLDYATTYYARAYGIYADGVKYGTQLSFTTLPRAPMVELSEVTQESGDMATFKATVTDAGRGTILERGVVYGTVADVTVDNGEKLVDDGAELGEYTGVIEDLMGNTKYYVRAYARNEGGVGYSEAIELDIPILRPSLVSDPVIAITKTTATFRGKIVKDGGAEVTSFGFVWSLNPNPDIEDSKVELTEAGEDGWFIYTAEELEENTKYYVRPYAINSEGIGYGPEVIFTTLADITKLYVVGDYNGWTNDKNVETEYIISTAESAGEAEGYIYLKAGGIKFIMELSSWDDATTFGDDGSGKLTNPGGNISIPEDGYYKLTANLSTMTYSILKLDWGIIGNATPGEWATDTPLLYDADLRILYGGFSLGDGELKFRANNDWGYNFGSDDADGNLQAGGGNIPVLAGDYSVTLDLSTPHEYTYRLDTWGVIGNATPGQWSDDTDMTWDADAGVFTVTMDLEAGEFKFRANNAWVYDLGGPLDSLVPGGGNISVSEAGNYTITLDPWKRKATMTKN